MQTNDYKQIKVQSYWKGSLRVSLNYGCQLYVYFALLYLQGFEYADCILCWGIRPTPCKKGCSEYDIKMHPMMMLQFWSCVEYPTITPRSTLLQSSCAYVWIK